MMGIEPITQRPRMDEALGVIIRLLDGEVVTHHADWFELHEARLQMLPVNGTLPIAVASTTSPAGMVCAGHHGVGVLSLGAGLIGGKKDLAAQWALGEKAAAAAGQVLRREGWRLVLRAHVAESREEAIADVRDGRERERDQYYRRVAGMKNDTTLEDEIEQDSSLDRHARRHDRRARPPAGVDRRLRRVHGAGQRLGRPREATLRSYELIARYVMPEVRGQIAPLRASYDMVAANKRSYGGPAMAAVAKAYADAGEAMPDGMDAAKLR